MLLSILSKRNQLQENKHLLNSTKIDNTASLNKTSKLIKKYIMQGNMAEKLVGEVLSCIYQTRRPLWKVLWLAVRSLQQRKFPGMHLLQDNRKRFLNVQGEAKSFIKNKRLGLLSLMLRAIFYRNEKHINHFKVG